MPQKVLMVDDEPLMHLLYKTHLEKAGYQMLAAKDGSEVVELAAREKPEAIIMDILMARVDGIAALRELKKNEATKTIPVIIITAHVGAHHATRQEAESAGAALLLTKPFSPPQLLAALRQVLPAPGMPGPSAAPQQ